MNSLALYE